MTSGTVLGVELGYARVSTAKQDLDRQIDALTTAGIPTDRIYLDKKSGVTTRPARALDPARLRPARFAVRARHRGYHARVPSRSVNVPVGPSRPIMTMETLASVPSATDCRQPRREPPGDLLAVSDCQHSAHESASSPATPKISCFDP